ncbi:MAG: hypothetical protein DRQ78_07940 [Epsilonproteobacteria bacterium]|nr:MAG: hypothetical protein DRQ78_07940 [Campylobacterota bacterium]
MKIHTTMNHSLVKGIFTFLLILGLLSSFAYAEESIMPSVNIVPKSGTWKPKMTAHNIKGCPPMMRGALEKEKFYSTSKKTNFSKPFHPNDIFDPKDINPEGNQNIKWTNPKLNFWKVTLLNNQEGMKVDMTWDLNLTSETTMDVTSHLSMHFPKEMAAMLGGSSECRVDSSGIIERIGD